jgi:hypothetical protein
MRNLPSFPIGPGDEVVTKQFLRAELAELRTGMERLHTQSIQTTLGALGVMTALITILS